MEKKHLSELTDQELLQEAKKRKSAAVVNALLVGFLAGIVIFSIVMSSWGLFTLIPLFFIYKLVNDRKYDSKELDRLLDERNLR
jgi:hypothetical protein